MCETVDTISRITDEWRRSDDRTDQTIERMSEIAARWLGHADLFHDPHPIGDSPVLGDLAFAETADVDDVDRQVGA